MNGSIASVLSGPEAFAEVCDLVKQGGAPLLIVAAASAEVLSTNARELVRELRTAGARTEFHEPGEGDTVVQSTNRLLADIPIDALMSRTEQIAPRLLVIDNAERMSEAEAASLGRLINGLFGSALRVIALVRHTPKRLVDLPIGNLGSLAVVWNLEPTTLDVADAAAAGAMEASSASSVIDVLKDIRVAPREEPQTMPKSTVASRRSDSGEIRDVLIELSKERAERRSFDVTVRSRRLLPILALLGAAIAVLVGFIALRSWLSDEDGVARQYVYDCGVHPDRESADTLLARLDRTVPTRVREQVGGYRVEVGPFAGKTAAEAMRPQIWRLGACRANPTVMRAEAVKPVRRGG
jgi:hypothetical protein